LTGRERWALVELAVLPSRTVLMEDSMKAWARSGCVGAIAAAVAVAAA
jgi:phage tail tape-measure protein